MKKSLEDMRCQYGEKRDDSGRGSASSKSSNASDHAIKEDERTPKLNIAPKKEAGSCPEFVKPHQQLLSTADFSKIDFCSSVIAGDLGQLYTNETVFNVFSESQCNSSLKSNGAPLDLPVDESIIQQPNLNFSKADFSSSSAAKNFSTLYTNESVDKLFPGSWNCSAVQVGPTAAANGLTTLVHCPPVEAREPLPIDPSKSDSSTSDGNKTSENHKVTQLCPSRLSEVGIPGQSGVRNSNSKIATGSRRMSGGNLRELMDHQLDQFVNPNIAARTQSNIMEKTAYDPKNSKDGNQTAISSSSPDSQLTPTGMPDSIQGLTAHPCDEFVIPNREDLTAKVVSHFMKTRANDMKNAKNFPNVEIEMLQEVDSYEKPAEITDKRVSPAVHSIFSSFETHLPVIPEETRESGVSQEPIASPPFDNPVSSRIPAGNDSNPTNPEQSIGTNLSKDTPSDEANPTPVETHSPYSILQKNSTSSDPVEYTESTYREIVSEYPISFSAGEKVLPFDELPVDSMNTCHCFDEPGSLPNPTDYVEHEWLFQKNKTIGRLLVFGTSGCFYEGEIQNKEMHGHGRFYFGEDQFIEASWKMNTLIELQSSFLTMKSCKQIPHFPNVESKFTIFKTGNCYLVSIYDGYQFVAITNPVTFKGLDFNEPVDNLKASFLGRFKIAEIIHDEWSSKRITSMKEFVLALKELKSEAADVLKNAETLFHLREFATLNFSVPGVLLRIQRNRFFPSSLSIAASNLLTLEDNFPRKFRDICMLDCPDEMKPMRLGWQSLQERMASLYTYRITDHRRSLLSMCPNDFPRLTDMIEIMPDEKILYITREDVSVFHHLLSLPCAQHDETYEYARDLFGHFVELLERKLMYYNEIPLSLIIPLISPVFGHLFKSFSDIAGEIVSKADRLCFQDMLLIDRECMWKYKREIPWTIEHKTSPESMVYCHSLVIQYSTLFDMLQYFSSIFFNEGRLITNKLLKLSEPVELERLSNERLAWLILLAESIPSQNIQAEEAVELYNPLIQCYISFLKNCATDAHELFRVVTHSIVRFVVTTITYTRQYNDSCEQHDTLLLEELMSLVIPRISGELEESTSLRDLIEELNRYWTLRRAINVKTRHLPAGWRLMDVFVPFVVRPTVCLEVPVISLVRYLRALNDFIDDLKDIDFENCWYVKSDAYHCTVMDAVNNQLLSSENCSYRVTNVDGFIALMEGKTLPKHYILEIVREMITNIMFFHTNRWNKKETLNNLTPCEKKAKTIEIMESTGMLLDVMRRSFLYLKEQPGYLDFETFKKAMLEPFDGLVFKSRDFNEYKNRIAMFMKESFWHTRRVNEIGIDQAIALFANVNDCPISNKLSEAYNLYLMQYNNNIETYFRRSRDRSNHAECLEAVKNSIKIPERVHFSNWTEDFKTKEIPKLLAGLSAVWSILMSGGVSNSEKFLMPHCIQILCILRLLSVDKPEGAENHLAQVSTGQGKSLVLGLLSSVLVLTGHKARIVCYSKYLSTRDENDFKEFFQHFGISDAITYGTFEDLANGFLTPLYNGVRTSVRKIVRDNVLNHADGPLFGFVETESRDTVLLIDEVDVFFDDRFYGNQLDSLASVKIPGLEHIQYKIWKIVTGSKADADRVQWLTDMHIAEQINSGNPDYEEWHAFCNTPGTFQLLVDDANGESQIKEFTNRSLVDEHLMMMSKDAILLGRSNKMDHMFRLDRERRLCMKNSAGQFVHTIAESYQNTFAYLKFTGIEYVPHNSSPHFGHLILKTGKISYARLPCQFPLIIGVSGTLKDLTEYEKKGIDSYVNEFSIVPSLFGESRLKFNAESDFKFVYKQRDWLKHIYNKVNDIVQSARAVLVFFDSDEQLNLFTDKCKTKFGRVNELTLNTDSKSRDRYITEAGISRTVTLATRAMGRGVDYESSVAVEKLGGIHVIQTFFSLNVKEEIQIRGRTARKDNEGSYELIICKEHLVHKRIIPDDASEHTYATLQPIRRKWMDYFGKRLADKIKKVEHDHEMAMMYYGMSYS